MDEHEMDQELNIEDILKEFAAQEEPADVPEEAADQIPFANEPPLEERLKAFLQDPDEVEEDVKRYVPNTEKADPAMEDQTIRIDSEKIRQAVTPRETPDGGTIRFEPVRERKEDTDGSEPEQEQSDQEIPEGAEPFTASWEPEYDAPMGEYVPPEPIVFQPRAKRHELKRKLIAGPERRYYALSEMGLGKLQAAIFVSILVVILSFVAIGMHSLGMVRQERMRLLVFGELFAMMLSALLSYNRILDGFASMLKGKFTPDTILGLCFLVCMADGVMCLREVRVPFCAAFCLEATMSLWAEHQRRNTEMGQMDTMRKATHLNRVAVAPDCFEDRPGVYVTGGEVEDFMDTCNEISTPERMLSWYSLLAFVATAVIAVIAGVSKGLSVGLQTWSAALLAAMPVTTFICQSRPAAVLERRFHKLGVVLCGWSGVKGLSGAVAVPLADTVLFPAGSMKINGVKFYSRRDPDQVVAYAAAILECTGNALTTLFAYLLDSRNGIHYEAESYASYENGGVGGEVCGESVLLGSVSFLQDMGVDIPEGTRVNQAVYVAVDGELCGVFALAFGKLKGVAAGLGSLCGYRGLTPVMTSDNFLLTEGFLRSKFSINTRRVAFPKKQERQALAAWAPTEEDSKPCALTTQDSFASVAFAITGARSLYTARNMGAFVHMIAGIVGMVMVLVLTMVEADTLLTPLNLLLFHLVLSIPGLLISEWTRHI